MKKRIFAMAMVLMSLVLILSLASCGEGGGETTPKAPNDNVGGDGGSNDNNDNDNNDNNDNDDNNNNNTGGGNNNGGESHTHSYGEWETVKAPTCKESGERSRSCECGDKQTEALEMVAHVESDWIVDKEATATEKGTRRKVCTVCGEKLAEEELPATGSIGLAYEKNSENTYTITGIGTCTETEIYIPEYINGGKVTAIDDEAFKGNKSITKVSIPGVYYVGESAFESCTALTEVKIGYGTEYIGASAFMNCTSLKSIDLPTSLEKISVYMLRGCESLERLDIPSGVASIGNGAFIGLKKLSYLSFPASIKNVGNGVFGTVGDFRLDSLKELHIESIASWAVLDFNNTNEGYGGNRAYCNPFALFSKADGKLYVGGKLITATDTLVIPEGVTRIGKCAFELYPYASISVPNSITYVGLEAFKSTYSLTYNEINGASYLGNNENPYVILKSGHYSATTCEIHPDTKVIMPEVCRGYNQLTSIVIPEGVVSIGEFAFYGCMNLSSVTIKNPETQLGGNAFGYCPSLPIPPEPTYTEYEGAYYQAVGDNPYAILVKAKDGNFITIRIHPDTKIISDYAFYNDTIYTMSNDKTSDLYNKIIPDGVTYIGEGAFCGCSFSFTGSNNNTENVLVIPDSVTYIGDKAFENCSYLRNITLSKNITSIGDRVFYNCSTLQSITIPEGITSIGDEAFYNCKELTDLVIPDSVRTIGDTAFADCVNIITVTVGKSVESIGEDAFEECKLITEIYNRSSLVFICGTKVHGEIAEFAKNEYSDTEGSKKLYTQDGYLFYVDGYTAIVLKYTGDATELVLPEKIGTITVEKYIIGEGAFKNNNTLESIILPENVVRIDAEAFLNCKKAKKIVIPEGVTQIGKSAFSGCSAVTELILPEELLEIGDSAFSGLSSLTQLELPKTLVSIGRSAFSSCSKLTSVVIPDSVTEIGKSAFHGCSKLTSIKLSSNITTLNSNVFYGTKLTELVIPDGVTTICKEAFYWGTIPRVVIPVSVTSIEERAFYDTLINEFVFEGTVEQWEAIEKSERWATRNYTIICTNGTVTPQ